MEPTTSTTTKEKNYNRTDPENVLGEMAAKISDSTWRILSELVQPALNRCFPDLFAEQFLKLLSEKGVFLTGPAVVRAFYAALDDGRAKFDDFDPEQHVPIVDVLVPIDDCKYNPEHRFDVTELLGPGHKLYRDLSAHLFYIMHALRCAPLLPHGFAPGFQTHRLLKSDAAIESQLCAQRDEMDAKYMFHECVLYIAQELSSTRIMERTGLKASDRQYSQNMESFLQFCRDKYSPIMPKDFYALESTFTQNHAALILRVSDLFLRFYLIPGSVATPEPTVQNFKRSWMHSFVQLHKQQLVLGGNTPAAENTATLIKAGRYHGLFDNSAFVHKITRDLKYPMSDWLPDTALASASARFLGLFSRVHIGEPGIMPNTGVFVRIAAAPNSQQEVVPRRPFWLAVYNLFKQLLMPGKGKSGISRDLLEYRMLLINYEELKLMASLGVTHIHPTITDDFEKIIAELDVTDLWELPHFCRYSWLAARLPTVDRAAAKALVNFFNMAMTHYRRVYCNMDGVSNYERKTGSFAYSPFGDKMDKL